MSEEIEIIELVLTPVPPDTLQSVKQELLPYLEAELRKNGHAELLASGQLKIQAEQTFPTNSEEVAIVIALASMAKDTYKELILPLLKRRFGIEEKSRKKKDKDKNSKRNKDSDEAEDAPDNTQEEPVTE